MNSPKSANNH